MQSTKCIVCDGTGRVVDDSEPETCFVTYADCGYCDSQSGQHSAARPVLPGATVSSSGTADGAGLTTLVRPC